MEKIKVNHIVLKVLGFSLALAPALLIAILLFMYSVNVPFLDDWEISLFLSKFFPQYHLTWKDLLSQTNETRYVFPRLIFMVLTYLNKSIWDVRYQMWVSFGLACIVSLNVYFLIRLTVAKNFPKVIFLWILCNLLIFAPIQYENWFWGVQVIVFMPIVCVTTCLVVIYSRINRKAKLVICLILCTVSTFSYANGMLSWIILLPVLAISKSWKWQDIFRDKLLYLSWIAAFTTNMVVYFYDYKKPPQTPSFIAALLSPYQSIQYLLSFLGDPLGWGTFPFDGNIKTLVNNNVIIGTIISILFIAAWLYLWKQRKDSALIYRMIPWLTIGSYTFISGIITSLGRVGFGLETSIALRYITFSVYLPLAIVNLIAIIYDDAQNRSYLLKTKTVFTQAVILVLLAGFLYFYIITSNFAIPRIYFTKLDRLQAKACLVFINVAPDEKCLKEKVYPHLQGLKLRAKMVNDLGLIDTRLVNHKNIQEIVGNTTDIAKRIGYGWFDKVGKVDKNTFYAGGWAILPERKEPADAVVLTYEKAKGEDIIIALSDARIGRRDVVKVMQTKAYLMSGWHKSFPASKLPKGTLKINAWAFDTETGKAFKIGGTHVIKNP